MLILFTDFWGGGGGGGGGGGVILWKIVYAGSENWW